MDTPAIASFVQSRWQRDVLPTLADYIAIPNKSPMFDPDWEAHGHMSRAVEMIEQWCRGRDIPDLGVEVVRLPGRTPLLFMEVEGSAGGTVLLYGHLDKQPEMTGWREDLGPWKPVFEDERLYGRGGADDGYAVFASLTAIEALLERGVALPTIRIIIEACEESGSYDLPHYIDALQERIGFPDLVVCLDSGCGNYDQLWFTTSLRGMVGGTLSVRVLDEGVHSGNAGGIVPCSFRIIRQLLDRIEDERTGSVRHDAFHVEIPHDRMEQARFAARVLGMQVFCEFPFNGETRAVTSNLAELILNRTWRPTLAVTGADGLPAIADAGNVLRPWTALRLSMRLPPTCDAEMAAKRLKAELERDPPHNATITFEPEDAVYGWNAPPLENWLKESSDRASREFFGKPAAFMGEGGSIPFMAMLGERFPQAQFLITGVLGPHSNAHGPNEFLHIPTATRVTCCVARVISDLAYIPERAA